MISPLLFTVNFSPALRAESRTQLKCALTHKRTYSHRHTLTYIHTHRCTHTSTDVDAHYKCTETRLHMMISTHACMHAPLLMSTTCKRQTYKQKNKFHSHQHTQLHACANLTPDKRSAQARTRMRTHTHIHRGNL